MDNSDFIVSNDLRMVEEEDQNYVRMISYHRDLAR